MKHKLLEYNALVRLPVQLVIWLAERVLTALTVVDLTCCYSENLWNRTMTTPYVLQLPPGANFARNSMFLTVFLALSLFPSLPQLFPVLTV